MCVKLHFEAPSLDQTYDAFCLFAYLFVCLFYRLWKMGEIYIIKFTYFAKKKKIPIKILTWKRSKRHLVSSNRGTVMERYWLETSYGNCNAQNCTCIRKAIALQNISGRERISKYRPNLLVSLQLPDMYLKLSYRECLCSIDKLVFLSILLFITNTWKIWIIF